MDQILTFLGQASLSKLSLIFMGGIHGVGKTTICSQAFKARGFHCVTGSSLIKNYGLKSNNNKLVDNLKDNQTALLDQLKVEKRQHSKLLLDGHYSLVNSDGIIEPIDLEVFKEIAPDLLILLKANPSLIVNRLQKRDESNWPISFIEHFQSIEEQHAINISNNLNIPLHIFSC